MSIFQELWCLIADPKRYFGEVVKKWSFGQTFVRLMLCNIFVVAGVFLLATLKRIKDAQFSYEISAVVIIIMLYVALLILSLLVIFAISFVFLVISRCLLLKSISPFGSCPQCRYKDAYNITVGLWPVVILLAYVELGVSSFLVLLSVYLGTLSAYVLVFGFIAFIIGLAVALYGFLLHYNAMVFGMLIPKKTVFIYIILLMLLSLTNWVTRNTILGNDGFINWFNKELIVDEKLRTSAITVLTNIGIDTSSVVKSNSGEKK